MNNLLDTLSAEGSFKTLISLFQLAGLTDRLRAPGPFTLFAPDDQAFTRVNIDVISEDRDQLALLLSYHLVEGARTSTELAEKQHLVTESGKSLTMRVSAGRQVVDNAKLVRTDITCSNGIIQVIDNVFLPQFSGWYCGGCC